MGLEHTISSTRRQVQAVQLEETRVNSVQVRAETIKMLSSLADLGFRFKQVPNSVVNSNASLPRGAWGDAPGPWTSLPSFPSAASLSRSRHSALGNQSLLTHARQSVALASDGRCIGSWKELRSGPMGIAYACDIETFSTNIVGVLGSEQQRAELQGDLKPSRR